MGKWGLKMGGRLEQAKVYAHFISSGTMAIQHYLNFIPNITLSRQLKGISMISASYTQRIERPNLQYLDPYVDLTDPWNISYGNPKIQPALANVFDMSYNVYIKKTSVNINVFHQFTNNSIQQFTTLAADTISRTTYGNIGKNQNSSFSVSGNTTLFKKLGITLNSTANYVQYTSNINGKPQSNDGLTYHISGSANLRLKSWRLGSKMSYNAPTIFLQGRSAGYISNSITINKYFFKNNKANIALSTSSPFSQYRHSFTEISDPTFYQLRKRSTVIRRFNISFSYRFSKL
jgi:outer membrane receptor protein involved in Fe transport